MAENLGEYNIDFSDAIKGFDTLGKADENFRAAIAQSGAVAEKAFAQAAAGAKQYENRLDAILAETRTSSTATQQFAGQVAGLVKEIRDTAAAQEASRKAAAAAADERRKATAAAREAAKAEKQAAKEAAAAAKAAGEAAKQSGGFFSGLIAKAKTSLSGDNLFKSLLSSATAAGAGFFAFNAIAEKVTQGLNNFSAITGVQATLKALTGSAGDGAREFAYVKSQAAALGLELIPTAKAYSGLYAAAKEANVPVAQTRAIFESVAGAAKVLNLSADDTNGVLLALQQIASKGTVASEELRGQIGERLPGAFGLAAKAMGLTTAELGKQLQAGKVLASDFLPKFAAQLKATYGGATAEAATQVGSNLGRINTFISESSAKFGMLFAPAVAALANFVSGSKTAAQVAADSGAAYFRQADAVKRLVPAVGGLLSNYESLNAISDRSIGQQIELDKTIQALAKTVPGAVTEFDKYGKALGINGDAVRRFIKDQQNLAAYLNRQALKDNSADLRRLLNEQQRLTDQLNDPSMVRVNGLARRTRAVPNTGYRETLDQAESDRITRLYTEDLAKVQDDIAANLENRQRLRGKSPLLPTGDPATNDKAIQGLIEKQEQLIKDLKERQKKATQENEGKGADFLFGKGGLNQQLDVANKELERLQGKVEKAKGVVDKLTPALRALAEERDRLTEAAAKAIAKESEDAALRAKLQFDAALRAADKIEAELKRREAAVRKAGGRGGNADGVIDGVQAKELSQLRLAAMDAYYTELYKITEAREQRLFDLRADTDQKEVEAIDRKYDKLIKASTDGIERQAIEEARQREQLALRQRQDQERIDRTAALASARAATTGATFGTGTGVSVIEAKRAEKRALLEIERKHAQDTLNNTLLLNDKEGELQRAQAEATIARVKKELEAVDQEKKAHAPEDFIYKLIFGEQDSQQLRDALGQVTAQVLTSVSEILNAQQQAASQKAATATQSINELQSQLQAEVALRNEGSASNIKTIQNEIAQQKQVRRAALEEQRQAARAQVIIDSITQASSIATAAANVFAAFSAIPFVGVPLGIGAAGLLVAAFVAAKAKAYQAASSIGTGGGGSFFVGGEYDGGYTGNGNAREVSTAQGPRPYEYHKREFIMRHALTDAYKDVLFQPLHEGRPENIKWDSKQMQALLPDYGLPQKLHQERAAAVAYHSHANLEPVRAELAAVRAELQHIRDTNQRMADQKIVTPLGPNRVLESDPKTGSTHIKNL